MRETLLAPEIDRLLATLSDHHRRLILIRLRREDVLTENDVRGRGAQIEEATKIQLTHNHLPKLADAGYIEWEQETGEISQGSNFEEIEPLVELMESNADDLPPDWP